MKLFKHWSVYRFFRSHRVKVAASAHLSRSNLKVTHWFSGGMIYLKVHQMSKLMTFSQVNEASQVKWEVTAEKVNKLHYNSITIDNWFELKRTKCNANSVRYRVIIDTDVQLNQGESDVHDSFGSHVTHDCYAVDVADLRKDGVDDEGQDQEQGRYDQKIAIDQHIPRILRLFGEANHGRFLYSQHV